jgi:hypothetical protein
MYEAHYICEMSSVTVVIWTEDDTPLGPKLQLLSCNLWVELYLDIKHEWSLEKKSSAVGQQIFYSHTGL